MGSDTSDTISDRPNEPTTDSDAEGTGNRPSVGMENAPKPEIGADRVARDKDVGLGGGLDQAEEAQLGITDDDLFDEDPGTGKPGERANKNKNQKRKRR
jgi:hypothetical protein